MAALYVIILLSPSLEVSFGEYLLACLQAPCALFRSKHAFRFFWVVHVLSVQASQSYVISAETTVFASLCCRPSKRLWTAWRAPTRSPATGGRRGKWSGASWWRWWVWRTINTHSTSSWHTLSMLTVQFSVLGHNLFQKIRDGGDLPDLLVL